MRSFQAITDEIDDLDIAVEELKKQIETFDLDENTFAFMVCGSEVDVHEFIPKLWDKLHIHFLGITSVGIMQNDGYSEASICITVMTSSDVYFHGGLSEEVNSSEDIVEIIKLYRELKEKMEDEEKLIVLYLPWNQNLVYDDVLAALDEESGGIPIFGGNASDDWYFNNTNVLYESGAYNNRAVMALIGGNIKPLFMMEQSATEVPDSRGIVTSAQKCIIGTVDDLPATEYLKRNGLENEKSFVIVDYLGSPFFTHKHTVDGDSMRVLRNLVMIIHEQKSILLLGAVEEGDELTMANVTVDGIEKSTRKAFEALIEQINQAEDYQYSTLICSSCAARYCFIVADKNKETRGYTELLPKGMNTIGAYLYGEYCPVRGKQNKDKLYNMFNNETFTIMAL